MTATVELSRADRDERARMLVAVGAPDGVIIEATGITLAEIDRIRATATTTHRDEQAPPAPPPTTDQPRPADLSEAYLHRVANDAALAARDAGGTADDIARAYITARQVELLRTREDARREYARLTTPPAPPFDLATLGDVLARPPEPPFRVERLIPSDAGTLLVAQRKAGKTTTVLNLTRALITGEEFLGEFPTRPIVGNVAFLNFEVSGATLARWAEAVGIDPHRLVLANLRGRRNPFAHDDDLNALAATLRAHDVETLIVDPFGRAYHGKSQNDPGEVGAWLTALDAFARADVGASDVILTAHAGWNGERTRGSSALEDWADTIITLTTNPGDDDEDAGGRYLRAIGRDVDVDEDRLDFDALTKTLTLSGTGSRKAGREARAITAAKTSILVYVQSNPECSGADIERNVTGGKAIIAAARKELVAAGTLLVDHRQGRGGGLSYTVLDVRGGTR